MNPTLQCYWVNIHPNLGDLVSCPAFYFGGLQPFRTVKYEKDDLAWIGEGPTIIGGGGMFFPGVDENLKRCLDYHKYPLIIWGIGLNYSDRPPGYPDWLRQFDLVGIRDANSPYPYVPCVSCMAKEFDREYEIKHDFCFYGWNNPFENDKAIPYLSQLAQTDAFENAIQFLAESRIIITSSYHGAYWAMLLNRIPVLWEPTSMKFFLFRKQPMICGPGSWKQIIKIAQPLHDNGDYLMQCRMRNMEFYANVKDLLIKL